MSVDSGDFRKNINKGYTCVTESWMKNNFDDRVKELFPLEKCNLIVKKEDEQSDDDHDKANQKIPCHLTLVAIFNNRARD